MISLTYRFSDNDLNFKIHVYYSLQLTLILISSTQIFIKTLFNLLILLLSLTYFFVVVVTKKLVISWTHIGFQFMSPYWSVKGYGKYQRLRCIETRPPKNKGKCLFIFVLLLVFTCHPFPAMLCGGPPHLPSIPKVMDVTILKYTCCYIIPIFSYNLTWKYV